MSLEEYIRIYSDYPGIKKNDNLFPLFCVESLETTRILSSHMRPPILTQIAKKELNIDNIDDLVGKKVYIIRRKVDENGIKIDNDYKYVNGIIQQMNILAGGYYFSSSTILNDNNVENICLNRLFIKYKQDEKTENLIDIK